MRLWLNIPVTAWTGAALLSAGVAVLAITLKLALGLNGENLATLVLLQVSAVLALAIFSGNSGIISFGHSAFMGIGAYTAGLLTMAAAAQKSALPALPGWLA
ncbi:MAG: hypothetical protein JNN02_09830, partial [Tabrizicola sp.]|nr:hypothetical protein [Tabrizicola sp.]